MKNKNQFKIGDKVFAIKNSAWGIKPMTITKFWDTSIWSDNVSCEHPDLGIGAFLTSELERFTSARQKKMSILVKKQKELKKLTKKYFNEL